MQDASSGRGARGPGHDAHRPPHRYAIEADGPVEIHVGDSAARWFRLSSALVESGAWARLGPAAKAVLPVLAQHVNSRSGVAYPGRTRIAALAGVSVGSVKRAIRELEEAGLLVRRALGGGSRTTVYELPEPPPRPEPPEAPDAPRSAPVSDAESEGGSRATPGAPVTPGSRATPEGARRRAGPGGAGAPQTRRMNKKNNDSAAAADLLVEGAGFSAVEARRLLERTGADASRVAEVLDSLAAAGRERRVRNPRGWIVKALEAGPEAWPAHERVQAKRREERASEGLRERRARRAEEEAREEEARTGRVRALFDLVDAAGDDELDAARRAFLAEQPAFLRRRFEGVDPRTADRNGVNAALVLGVARVLEQQAPTTGASS